MDGFEIPDWAAPEPVSAPEAPPPDPAMAREQQIADTTRAEQGLNQFLAGKQHALFEAPDAFYRQQGEDAIHAAPAATQKLDELRADLLDKLGNDAQRDRLRSALDAQMELARDGMSRHVAEQSHAWQRHVAQDRIALLAKEAAYHHNDDELVDALGHAAASAARAHARVGAGPPGDEAEDAAAATARSSVLGTAIQARLDRGNTAGANALFTQVQDQLDRVHAEPLRAQLDPAPARAKAAAGSAPAAADDTRIISDATPDTLEDGQRFAAGNGSNSSGRTPRLRLGPGGRGLTVPEETRWDFFQAHEEELRELEPNNPKLTYVTPPGWIPTQRNIDDMVGEVRDARARIAKRALPDDTSPGPEGRPPGMGHNSGNSSEPPSSRRSDSAQPPLWRMHSDETTMLNNRPSYEFWSNRPTEEIVKSLEEGQREPLIVKKSGQVSQGNTRIKILQERGYDVNSLPRVPHDE